MGDFSKSVEIVFVNNLHDYYYPTSSRRILYNTKLGPNSSISVGAAQEYSSDLAASSINSYYCNGLTGDCGDAGSTFASAATMDSLNMELSCASTIEPCSCSIETGRVEEGSYSNQKFSYVNYDFEDYPWKIETIKILPLSRKPYTQEDLQKRYCSNCGRKLSPKHKFCPYCGTKVE